MNIYAKSMCITLEKIDSGHCWIKVKCTLKGASRETDITSVCSSDNNMKGNFSKNLSWKNLSKIIFLQKSTPFPNTHYKLKY